MLSIIRIKLIHPSPCHPERQRRISHLGTEMFRCTQHDKTRTFPRLTSNSLPYPSTSRLVILSVSEGSHALDTTMHRLPSAYLPSNITQRLALFIHPSPCHPERKRRISSHDHNHPRCHSSLKSRHSGLIDSIKATFFARNQPFRCFSRAIAAYTSGVSSK